jgi:hypothetical protein
MSKYPNFDRVTAGRLSVGDTILIRDGAQDLQWVELPTWVNDDLEGGYRRVGGVSVAGGTHKVTKLETEWHQAGRKRSRYYNVTLDNGQTVNCSSVQRWNRVVA